MRRSEGSPALPACATFPKHHPGCGSATLYPPLCPPRALRSWRRSRSPVCLDPTLPQFPSVLAAALAAQLAATVMIHTSVIVANVQSATVRARSVRASAAACTNVGPRALSQTSLEWRALARNHSAEVLDFQAEHSCCGLSRFDDHGVGDCVVAAAAVPQPGCAGDLAAEAKSWMVTAWLVSLGTQLLVVGLYIAVRWGSVARAADALWDEASEQDDRAQRRQGERKAAVAVQQQLESVTPKDALEEYARQQAARVIQRAYLLHALRVKVRSMCAKPRSCRRLIMPPRSLCVAQSLSSGISSGPCEVRAVGDAVLLPRHTHGDCSRRGIGGVCAGASLQLVYPVPESAVRCVPRHCHWRLRSRSARLTSCLRRGGRLSRARPQRSSSRQRLAVLGCTHVWRPPLRICSCSSR